MSFTSISEIFFLFFRKIKFRGRFPLQTKLIIAIWNATLSWNSLTLFRGSMTNPYSREIGKITYLMHLAKSLSLLAKTLHLTSLSCKFFKFILILVIGWWNWHKLWRCQQKFKKIWLFLSKAFQHRDLINIHNHITNFIWN